MNRTDFNTNLGKCHLIKHQTSTGMKCFTNNESRIYFYSFFINNFSRKESIITSMSCFVFSDDCIGGNTVFYQNISKKFTIRLIISVVYICLWANPLPFIPLYAYSAGRYKPFRIAFVIKICGIFRLLRVWTTGQKNSVCLFRLIGNKYVIWNICYDAILHSFIAPLYQVGRDSSYHNMGFFYLSLYDANFDAGRFHL